MPGFINPYHFVPIANKAPERKPVQEQRGTLWGSIECTLTLHSPLAMPDHEHPQLFENPHKKGEPLKDSNGNTIKHFYYPFYSLDEKYPLIPGSELRGMIRSVYEAETNSCLGIFDNAELTGRSQITKLNGGLIYKTGDQWFLEPADIYLVNTFSRVNSQKGGQPEHLEIDQWTHQLILKNNKRISNGSCVTFNDSHISYKTADKIGKNGNVRPGANTGLHFASDIGNGSLTGWLLIGERGLAKLNNRHNSHILSPRTGGKIEMISQETVDKLQAVLNLYRKPEINKTLKEKDGNEKKHTGYAGYSIKTNGEKTPVFYTKEGDYFYLSPAMKGREVYYRQLYQVVGDHVPCGIRSVGQEADQLNEKKKPGEDLVCPACALFGTMPDKTAIRSEKTILQNSYGSAIRFSDALWCTDQDPQWLEREGSKKITLPELSSPKITSSEFYSHLAPDCRSNEDGIWNMDYKTRNITEKVNDREQKVVRMFPLKAADVKINGRKFFWHQPEFANAKAEDQAARLMPNPDVKTGVIWTERNISTQILKDGEFQFTVYFDGIQKDQLDKLIWALSPKSEDRKLYHKIGFGKPLGLGSVEIRIQQVITRTYENGVYQVEEYPDWTIDKTPAEMPPNELVEILDFERTGKYPVSYPIGKETEKNGKISEGALIWFKYNRSVGTTAERPAVNYTLPRIEKGNPKKGFDLVLPNVVNGQFMKPIENTNWPIGDCKKCKKRGIPINPLFKMCEDCIKKITG